jgi:uncharacterized protein (DUF1778 family)
MLKAAGQALSLLDTFRQSGSIRQVQEGVCRTCHMTTTKTTWVHLRIAAEDKELFERVGSMYDESLTEFLVESGRERVERLLANRTHFALDDADWRAFTAALDRPAEARPELARLFARPRPE